MLSVKLTLNLRLLCLQGKDYLTHHNNIKFVLELSLNVLNLELSSFCMSSAYYFLSFPSFGKKSKAFHRQFIASILTYGGTERKRWSSSSLLIEHASLAAIFNRGLAAKRRNAERKIGSGSGSGSGTETWIGTSGNCSKLYFISFFRLPKNLQKGHSLKVTFSNMFFFWILN